MLRKLLVGSAHYILGPFGSDSDLRRHGEKIASRGAKNAKKRAAVAVARKLSVLLHSLWISGKSTILSTMPIVANSGRKRLKRRGAMEQSSKEEVKIPAHSGEATPKWRMATAVLGRALRISIRRLRKRT